MRAFRPIAFRAAGGLILLMASSLAVTGADSAPGARSSCMVTLSGAVTDVMPCTLHIIGGRNEATGAPEYAFTISERPGAEDRYTFVYSAILGNVAVGAQSVAFDGELGGVANPAAWAVSDPTASLTLRSISGVPPSSVFSESMWKLHGSLHLTMAPLAGTAAEGFVGANINF